MIFSQYNSRATSPNQLNAMRMAFSWVGRLWLAFLRNDYWVHFFQKSIDNSWLVDGGSLAYGYWFYFFQKFIDNRWLVDGGSLLYGYWFHFFQKSIDNRWLVDGGSLLYGYWVHFHRFSLDVTHMVKSSTYNCSYSHVTLLDWLKVLSQHR